MSTQTMDVALVGIGGYGAGYLDLLVNGCITSGKIFAVDPYVRDERILSLIASRSIPLFKSLDELFQHFSPTLTIVSSPVQYHSQHVKCALENESHVLCEKPMVVTLEQAREIRALAEKKKLKVAVGFQLCYAQAIAQLKEDIQKEKFGKIISMGCLLSWPRSYAYYRDSNWRGRVFDQNGLPVFDSILSNAGSHYFHLMCYLLGNRLDTSAMPLYVQGSLYRAYSIDTYDTCFLTGAFMNGCTFTYYASHASDSHGYPQCDFHFEYADISFNTDTAELIVKQGESAPISLGFVRSENVKAAMLTQVIDSIVNEKPLACQLETVLPHLAVCEGAFRRMKIHNIPKEFILESEDKNSRQIKGIDNLMKESYVNGFPIWNGKSEFLMPPEMFVPTIETEPQSTIKMEE